MLLIASLHVQPAPLKLRHYGTLQMCYYYYYYKSFIISQLTHWVSKLISNTNILIRNKSFFGLEENTGLRNGFSEGRTQVKYSCQFNAQS